MSISKYLGLNKVKPNFYLQFSSTVYIPSAQKLSISIEYSIHKQVKNFLTKISDLRPSEN